VICRPMRLVKIGRPMVSRKMKACRLVRGCMM
jgi:hypothetical protein